MGQISEIDPLSSRNPSDVFLDSPLNSHRPRVIPDHEIGGGNTHFWSALSAKFKQLPQAADPSIVAPEYSIGEISLHGFKHIDADKAQADTDAKVICGDLIDPDNYWLTLRLNRHLIAIGGALTPFEPEALIGKGPFHIEISPEQSHLVFRIRSSNSVINETAQIVLSASALFSGKPFSGPYRLAEKFAQQNCYIGFGIARLMYKLGLRLITPAMMARPPRFWVVEGGVNNTPRLVGPPV